MVVLVATCTRTLGVSFERGLPWDPSEVLRTWTAVIPAGRTILMTSTTYYQDWVQTSDVFEQWRTVVLTRQPDAHIARPNVVFCREFPSAADELYCVGGTYAFEACRGMRHRLMLRILDRHAECDRFLPLLRHDAHALVSVLPESGVVVFDDARAGPAPTASTMECFDQVYLDLARRVLASNDVLHAPNEAALRLDRTGTGTYSVFGDQIRFDISTHVPLLTTKHVPWRMCVEELLWFLHGRTDAKELARKGVRVWDGNSSREFLDKSGLSHLREGDCGANYSFQWRYFGQRYVDCDTAYAPYTASDQVANILRLLRTDPTSRRMVLSAWNPCDLQNTALPPCHMSAQFYVSAPDPAGKGRLSCHMYQRSCDVFLGLPWNIFSYTALTYLLAKMTGHVPGELVISFGDAHVYADHWNQIKTQMERPPLASPMLVVADGVREKRLEDVVAEDFRVYGYHHHPRIKARMSV